MSSFSGLRSCE